MIIDQDATTSWHIVKKKGSKEKYCCLVFSITIGLEVGRPIKVPVVERVNLSS
jgi:hypothetical protein